MPERLRCLELQLLLNVTARGFGAAAKGIWFLPYERALREYAAFTADRENVEGVAADLMDDEALPVVGLGVEVVYDAFLGLVGKDAQ